MLKENGLNINFCPICSDNWFSRNFSNWSRRNNYYTVKFGYNKGKEGQRFVAIFILHKIIKYLHPNLQNNYFLNYEKVCAIKNI